MSSIKSNSQIQQKKRISRYEEMYTAIIVVIILTITQGWSLECGLHVNENEDFKRTITECVRDNKTLEELWEAAAVMSSEEDDSTSSNFDEKLPNSTTIPPQDGKIARNFRLKKRSSPFGFMRPTYHSFQRQETPPSRENSSEIVNDTFNLGGDCVIQCIFEKLELTDATGFPQHDVLLQSLLKSASGREFRDFVQDSTDDCYQLIDKERGDDPCQYSIRLSVCLAEKGKSNCADWPVGDLAPLN